jgi:hypothetical protein
MDAVSNRLNAGINRIAGLGKAQHGKLNYVRGTVDDHTNEVSFPLRIDRA